MKLKALLAEQEFTGFVSRSDLFEFYAKDLVFGEDIDAFAVLIGSTYTVVWDSKEYVVTAKDASVFGDGTVLLGNGSIVDLGGNNEPFAIGWSSSVLTLISLDEDEVEGTSHHVAIYEHVSDGIVIKDPQGRSIVYGEYDKILINRSSGEKTIYSQGDAEATSIKLDFSKGDMTLTPDYGKLWSGVTIPQPDTLRPENILNGIDIAGIIGEMESGGSTAKIAHGVINGDKSTAITISHNLGVVPDIIFLIGGYKKGYVLYVFGVSTTFGEKIGKTTQYRIAVDSDGTMGQVALSNGVDFQTTYSIPLRNANEQTFDILGVSTFKIPSGSTWVAVGGLT